MNSPLPPIPAWASAGSSAASFGRSKNPPTLPMAAFAALNARRVEAAPQAEMRKCRRETPRRFAFVSAASRARRFAARFAGDNGTGANSPLDVVSSLIGRRLPSGSRTLAGFHMGGFMWQFLKKEGRHEGIRNSLDDSA